MTVITIRNVPDELRDKLAARAKAAGQSMQQYLLSELGRSAGRADNDALIAAFLEKTTPVVDQILAARDAERNEREQRLESLWLTRQIDAAIEVAGAEDESSADAVRAGRRFLSSDEKW